MKRRRYIGINDKHGTPIKEGDKVRILYTDWPSQSDYSISHEEYIKSLSHYGTVEYKPNEARFLINAGVDSFGEIVWLDFNKGPHGEIEIQIDSPIAQEEE